MAVRRSRARRVRKGGIKINPANRGKLRATAGVKKGKKIPMSKLRSLAASKNPTTRKRAQFAINARKFKH